MNQLLRPQIGSSGGIAHIAHGAADVEALLKQADAAKASGKNRVLPDRGG